VDAPGADHIADEGVLLTTEHWRTFGRLTLTIRYRAMTVRKTWMKPEDKTSVLGLEAKSRGRVVSITELDPGVFSSIMAHFRFVIDG